jgi:hypothetical protein
VDFLSGSSRTSLPAAKITSNSSVITIYYSKPKSVGWLLAYLVLESATAYYFHLEQVGATGWYFLLLGGTLLFFSICRQLVRLANNQPQLTLSDQGIRCATAPLDVWESIQGEEVRAVQRGRGKERVLSYQVGGQMRQLRLDGLAISAAHLRQLLLQYRTCFQQQAVEKAVAKYQV